MKCSKSVISHCLSWLQEQPFSTWIRKKQTATKRPSRVSFVKQPRLEKQRQTLNKFRCCFYSLHIQKNPISDSLHMFGTTIWKYYESKMGTSQVLLTLCGWSSSCQSVGFSVVKLEMVKKDMMVGWGTPEQTLHTKGQRTCRVTDISLKWIR